MVVFGNKKFRYLTHSNFESALLGANLITKEAKGWNPIVAKEGILFNLSRIEWVEIRALVHFVIFVEAAVRDKISVKIALPLTRATKREEALVQSCVVADADKIIRRKVEKREKALAFMEYLGFFNALKLPHLQGSAKLISLVYDLDPFDEGVVRLKLNIPTEEAKDSITSDSLIDVSEPLYEKIFPLKWVSISDPSSIEPILSFFTHVITSDNNPGLEGVDARTISNVILKELVENVQRHANTTQWALVAAHAAKRTISKAYIEEYCSHFREVERPYIEWQSKVGGGWLEIIVGDSGVGIPATLGEAYYNKSLSGKAPKDNSLDTAAIIKWSFDRWSSKDKTTFERGTRGLYRLDRVARKYHGLVSIRSGNAMAGWDHGGTGYHQSIVDPKPLRLIPGTICYYRSLTALHQPVIWRGLGGAENKVRFEIVSMGALTDNGIDENALEKLRNLVVSSSRSESLCIIASVDSMRSSEEGVGKALQQLTEIRHPPALVVHGLPGDWLSIENKVDSINRVFQASHHGEESHKPDHYLIWDPILVLGENVETQWAWAGVGEDQNWLLKALMSSENGVIKADIIGKHFTNDEHRRALLLSFHNEDNLIRFSEDGSVQLTFDLEGILKHIAETIRGVVEKGCNTQTTPNNVIFRTPSLMYIWHWSNLRGVISEACGVDLGISALAFRIKHHPSLQKFEDSKRLVIYGDSSVPDSMLELLRKLLGAHRVYKEPREPEASFTPDDLPLLDRDAHVVLFSSILLSGGTAKRCLSRVLLSEAKPVLLACLIDSREKSEESIQKWGKSIPVVRLAQAKIIAEQDHLKDQKIRDINSITGDLEEYVLGELEEDLSNYLIPPDELYKMISEQNALHFNHVYRGLGRHFTFYLDAEKLIDNQRIMDAFISAIGSWKNCLGKYRKANLKIGIMYPAPESHPLSPASKLSLALWKQKPHTFNEPRQIHRNAAFGQWLFSKTGGDAIGDVVTIIDWGSLSGASLMQMIYSAAEAGADHILACIFLSQLPAHEKRLLTSLNTLSIQRTQTENNPHQGQLSLFSDAVRFEQITVEVRVIVKFISALPIRAYSQHDCPVCQMRRQLENVSKPWAKDFLLEYRRKRLDELQHREREDVTRREPMDFRGISIPGERIVEMLKMRERLEKAQTYTAWREKIREEVDDCVAALSSANHGTKLHSKALPLLHLLAVETHWLKLAPLNIERLRLALANIAYLTATNKVADPSDRLRALTVLRDASKSFFIDKFQDLFMGMRDVPDARSHLMYDTAIYISRSYHQTAEMLEPIRNQIDKTLRLVNEEGITASNGECANLSLLLGQAELAFAQAKASPKTLPEAWLELKNLLCTDYRKAHHRVSSHFVKLMPGAAAQDIGEMLERQVPLPLDLHPWFRSFADTWRVCQVFLDQEILPLLAHLKNLILSEEGEKFFGGKTHCQKLCQMIENRKKNISLVDSSFTITIRDISKSSEASFSANLWKQFCDGSYWYDSMLMNPGLGGDEPSLLINLLNSAPSHLGKILRDVYEEERGNLGSHEIIGLEKIITDNPFVLCSSYQLREVIGELFNNCRKHALDSSCFISIELAANFSDDDDAVIFSMINQPVKLHPGRPGLGLEKAKNRLHGYGASIKKYPHFQRASVAVKQSHKIDIVFLRGKD